MAKKLWRRSAKRSKRRENPSQPSAQVAKPSREASKPSQELSRPNGQPHELGWAAAVVANLLILGIWVYGAVVRDVSKDFYYMSSQEDEYLEWGTFWAFMIAAVVGVLAAVYQRRATGRIPWFLAGVSLFCVVVAMEEISWGQRVLAYRPPVYFLENNFQQELNFHNVISTKLRKLALKGVILGYGVVLPLLALVPAVRKQLGRAAVVVPPLALVPSFFATFAFYQAYPWSFTGEWVEVMLGFGFLFAAIAAVMAFREDPGKEPSRGPSRRAVAIAVSWILVVGIGVANAAMSRSMRGADPAIIEAARGELEALKRDFLSGEVKTKCNRHRRLYTFMEKYGEDGLLEGEFAGLTAQGLPEERARFFIDPWNSPYWIRDRCKSDDSRRVVFVYSFGPNRRRESSRYEILGDDIGAIIYDGKKVKRLPTRSGS